jgi:hypothetical protein
MSATAPKADILFIPAAVSAAAFVPARATRFGGALGPPAFVADDASKIGAALFGHSRRQPSLTGEHMFDVTLQVSQKGKALSAQEISIRRSR